VNFEEQRARAAAFRAMHRGPKTLVLPNAWDCLSARIFEQAGFPAIATTSGGIAAVFGYPDGQKISAREMLQMCGRIAETISLPVTADLESGYGTTPDQIAETMRDAMSCGIVGANLEDGRGPGQPLADAVFQVEAIRAIRAVAKSSGMDFVLNARVDVFLYGSGDDASRFKEAIRRAHAYRDAGADCIFLMRLTDREIIRRIVPEIGCPVNIMAGHGAPSVSELEQLGVARVTFGTGLIRATLPLVRKMAEALRATEEFPALEQTEFTHAAVNELFKKL
jgi:2-methylisocitrate lyase-like PEP mutase family enzyme